MRTSFRKYRYHVVLCTTRNEVWNVTVSNSICFRWKSCVQLLKQHTKFGFADTSTHRSFVQEIAAAHYDIRKSQQTLWNNIDTKVCFLTVINHKFLVDNVTIAQISKNMLKILSCSMFIFQFVVFQSVMMVNFNNTVPFTV